jgi:signal transduction histidine kinase
MSICDSSYMQPRKGAYYNRFMKRETNTSDVLHLIRYSSLLWIGYLAVLAIINQSLWDPRQVSLNTLYYYYLLAVVALLCLGLTYWSWIQEKLGRAFLPGIIAVITVLPMLATWGIIQLFPHTPMLDPQSSVTRLIPFFLVSFLLVAWQYKWPYMLLIIFGITGLNLGVIWSFLSSGPSFFQESGNASFFRGALTVTLIQAVVFLAVGFSISFLLSRLRRQQESLESANKQLTHYASTLEHLAIIQERNRLAREMHDTLAHTLSGLSVQLETIKAYWDVDTTAARSLLDKSLTSAHSGLEETRRALKALRASPLDDLGLAGALSALARDMAARANLTLDLSVAEKLPPLSPDIEQAIYRVAQEALTNVINHGQAKNILVKLESSENKIKLTIRDDGIGFNAEKNGKPGHFGLTGIKERAKLVGGELNILSQPGNGTTIQLWCKL